MWLLVITTRQWSLGQGNVLHLSVSHSVHREIGFPASSLHRGRSACRGICIQGGVGIKQDRYPGGLPNSPWTQTPPVCLSTGVSASPTRGKPRGVCIPGRTGVGQTPLPRYMGYYGMRSTSRRLYNHFVWNFNLLYVASGEITFYSLQWTENKLFITLFRLAQLVKSVSALN